LAACRYHVAGFNSLTAFIGARLVVAFACISAKG
jgi:hypothetical protein